MWRSFSAGATGDCLLVARSDAGRRLDVAFPDRNSRVCRELVQQNLRLLEVRQIEALAERAVDRRQHRARLAMPSLTAPKLDEACGGAQRQRLLPAPGRQIERLAPARFRAVRIGRRNLAPQPPLQPMNFGPIKRCAVRRGYSFAEHGEPLVEISRSEIELNKRAAREHASPRGRCHTRNLAMQFGKLAAR